MRRHVCPSSYMLVCFLFVVLLAGCGTPVPASNTVVAAPPRLTATTQSSPAAAPSSTARPMPTASPAPAAGAAEDLDPAHDLAALSDEFDDPRSLASWKELAQVEGFPNWIEQLDVNATSPGELYLVPRQSG